VVRANAPQGFYHIDEIIPDAFRESDYYRIYYQAKRSVDEGIFFVPIGTGISVGLLAERRHPTAAFTAAELEELRNLAPLLSALIRHRWLLVESPTKAATAMAEQMTTALDCFGRETLSDRERQIAALILHGHSSKSGARELGISPETERVHRKRLYGKLSVSGQSELFWLFIQAVKHFDPLLRNDPLKSLLEERH
jgi:DNA-binding CsgD family transcriptional regulator